MKCGQVQIKQQQNTNENNLKKITEEYQRGGPQLPLSPSDEQIITFYSDRNLNERMEFKNPNVAKYYESRESTKDNKETNRLLTNYSETEYGERQGRGEQGQLRREFNDRDFLRPADESIAQINAHNDENIRDFIFNGYVIIFEINENIEILNIYKHNLPK